LPPTLLCHVKAMMCWGLLACRLGLSGAAMTGLAHEEQELLFRQLIPSLFAH
jgi:hypothetical protein